jgi:lipopolysaccharide biosynthesis glycosyltransferase
MMDNLGVGLQVRAYVIDGGVSEDNKRRISESLAFPNLEIIWLTISTAQARAFSTLPELPKRWPLVVNYRLLMPELLPDAERAIYLDSDTLVLGDLWELWCHDLSGKHVGMARTPGVSSVAGHFGMKHYEKYGLDPTTPYFNSGVLLADLARLRADESAKKLMSFLEHFQEIVALPDMDALNVVLRDKISELDPSWNTILKGGRIRLKYIFAQHGVGLHPIIGAKIYHYTEVKPWEYGCLNVYRSIFFQYLDKTAWAGWRPEKWKDRLEQARFGTKKIRMALRARLIGAK